MKNIATSPLQEPLRGSSFFMPTDSLHGLRRPYMPVFEAEGGPSGDPAPAAEPDDDDDDIPDAPVRVKTGKEKLREATPYEVALRKENQKWRQRARDAEEKLKTSSGADKSELERKLAEATAQHDAAIAAEKAERERVLNEAKTAHEQALTEAKTGAEKRIVRAEVLALAMREGLQHAKGLDMLDLADVKLDEQGNVVVPEDFFAKAKEEYGFLFQPPTGAAPAPKPASTNPDPTPSPKTPFSKKAADMSDEEWKRAQAHARATGRLPS